MGCHRLQYRVTMLNMRLWAGQPCILDKLITTLVARPRLFVVTLLLAGVFLLPLAIYPVHSSSCEVSLVEGGVEQNYTRLGRRRALYMLA